MSKDYRAIPAEEVLARLSPEGLARVNARTLALLAEEIGLADLRRLKGVTQEAVAKKLRSRQAQVSRLEKREDVKLSTLEKYFAALGAKLEIIAVFPGSGLFRLARVRPSSSRRRGRGAVTRRGAAKRTSRRKAAHDAI
jgi:transcriptional regulator with XRE-family HTH domain